ncbi:MAG: alpha/beta hydrolase fold domain-containing protein [Prevotella sp.]|nr:alpha/beta hydrolase fold domain-containing protein [Prevotella sp.]
MRKKLLLLALMVCAAVTAQTENRQIKVTENIAYRTDVGPSTVLDMAEPLFGEKSNRAAILIIHGGGWSAGSKNDLVYRSLMVDMALKGYVVCNMNYRLVQEAPMPACIEDVKSAVNWMKSNAERLGIDANRIGTYGHSAGGHLSLMAGLTAGVACAAGGAPPTEIGNPNIPWSEHPEWWPIGYIGQSETPFLVLQGGEDPIVKPNLTEDWVTKMQKAGARVDYVKVHGDHGVAFDKQLEFTRPALDAFFARHLKHEDQTASFEQMKVVEFGGNGPHKAIAVREKSLPDFVVYRPLNMDAAMIEGRPRMFETRQLPKKKLPVLVWCNGGCMDTSIGYENMLSEVASYGYVVVAIGEMQMIAQHEKDQHTPSSMVRKALDWIEEQAKTPGSPYYNKIDTDKIAAAGHSCGGAQVLANAADPRLKTYLILNAGMGKMTMADASSKSLKRLHAPILYLVGGKSDVAWQNAQMDYKAIKHVPVVLADNTQSGHGGTYEQPHGGDNARMVRAWLDWQLKGKEENKKLFIDGDLSTYDGFTMMHKNYKPRK